MKRLGSRRAGDGRLEGWWASLHHTQAALTPALSQREREKLSRLRRSTFFILRPPVSSLMRTLVTGASGFLGLYIVEQLVARGDEVRAFCRSVPADLQRLGVEIVRGDIRDRDAVVAACAGRDTVFHVAGVAGVWGSWRHYYEINTLGTEHVIAGCRRHGVGRLVFTSSPSVTFDGRDQNGIDESAPYPKRWLCHYPHTKAFAEQSVLAANDTGGLLTCALRPHLIWGPRDRHLIPRLLERQRRGQLRRIGDGGNLIDMVYVENAAAAHLQAADALAPGSPVAGRAYFISQGEPVNCWQWIDEILALAGLPPVRGSIPLGAAWAIGAGLERFHAIFRRQTEPRMTRFLAAQLGRSHYFNIERARQDFGYQPRISTAEGMERLGRSLRPAN
jgi:nucleoside-diphosphate-sugar epimerase